MKPETLDVATDYRLALLWLMERIESAPRHEVRATFDRELCTIIPSEHRQLTDSGHIKWHAYASWARTSLIHMGLMASAGHGVWSITPAGKEWLLRNPQATSDHLAAFRRLVKREGVAGAMAQAGIEAQQVGGVGKPIATPARGQRGASRAERRDEFFAQISGLLTSQLPGDASHGEIRHYASNNHMAVIYREFPTSHYELRLARGFDEVAFHFEGKRELNLARLAHMEPHARELSAALGHDVVAEPWGPNWARVAIDLPPAQWTTKKADEYATLLVRFIEATYPLLQNAFAAVPSRRRSRARKKPISTAPSESQAHAILDQQLAQIRTFLQGRSARPSDEVLCDWVQFCYTFEMFDEGYELFKLVAPSAVNDWLYRRAKKLAQVCRIRAQNKG